MSITTLLGVLAAFGLFFGSIMITAPNVLIFLDSASFIMVLGGTLSSMFIAYEPRYVILSLRLLARIMASPKIDRGMLKAEIGRVIRWAYTVQKNGIPALEQEAKRAVRGDKFLKFGIEMVISGYTGQEVREILTNTIETSFGRNMVQVKILKDMGAAAPAFGMIGTLVGLIVMLSNMGGDPTVLGSGLSVALITTLYGIFFARLIFIPAASKIQQREQILRFRNYLICEGLTLLADKKSPRYIQDKMNSYLDPAIHFNIDKMRR